MEAVLIAFGGVVLFGLICLCGSRLAQNNRADRAIGPTVFLSGKAVELSSDLDYEFHRFVMAIAAHQARLDGKELTTDGRSEIPEEKLISEQDLQKAFLRAVKEVGEWDYTCGACQNTPLHRIRKLIEKYEPKTP
jgi:hypothetical protein